MKTSRCFQAFTLLELLGVLAIVLLLLGLLLGPITKGLSKAKKLNRQVGEGQTNIIEMQKPGGLLSAD